MPCAVDAALPGAIAGDEPWAGDGLDAIGGRAPELPAAWPPEPVARELPLVALAGRLGACR